MATWQFAGDHGQFNNFDEASTGALEQCWTANNEKGTAKLFVKGWTYEYDFDNMTQRNTSTNKTRKIQRTAPKKDDDKTKGAAGKRTRQNNDDASDDDEAGKTKSHKPETGKKSANDKSAKKSGGSSNKSTAASLGKVVIKGKGAVDSYSGKQDDCHVIEEGEVVYQCTLNQTNIANNNNKFYIIQALEKDDGSEWFLWTRWGRLGEQGQSALQAASKKAVALKDFKKKFNDKTSNNWDTCGADYTKFVKKDGKYQLMAIDLGNSTTDKLDKTAAALDEQNKANAADGKKAATPKVAESKLPRAVQDLMKLLGSKEQITRQMKELNIDTNKMPLGMISKDQIALAHKELSKLDNEIKKANPSADVLNAATSAFYTLIPHDFGRRKPEIITTEEILQQKVDLLDVLVGAEVAAKLMENNDSTKVGADAAAIAENALDVFYKKLKTTIRPLEKGSAEFERLEEYLQNTHAPTHTMYKLKVTEIFAVDREGEAETYKKYKDVGNRQLLYHGSRLANWASILSTGLRIAPPGVPKVGAMFNHGIYLADVSSKSANYCFTTSENTTGLMCLLESPLGEMKELKRADSSVEVKNTKFHSVKGVGRSAPDESKAYYETVEGKQVKTPMGKIKPTGVNDTVLLYPEYVVYDVHQVRMRYLYRLEFIYNKKCGTFH